MATTFITFYTDWLDQELGTDQTTLFTVVRRKAAVNEGVREFARLTECFTRQASIALVNSTAEYDLETGITAGDFAYLAKQGVEVKKIDASADVTYYGGDNLVRRDIAWLNRYDSNWRNASDGTPTQYYLREDGGKIYIGLNPAPLIAAGETWTLTVPYVAIPGDMTNTTDKPFTTSTDVRDSLSPWHRAIVYFAAERLELLRRDREASQMFRAKAMDLVADYLQRQRPKGGHHVTFARDYRGEASTSTSTTTEVVVTDGGGWVA